MGLGIVEIEDCSRRVPRHGLRSHPGQLCDHSHVSLVIHPTLAYLPFSLAGGVLAGFSYLYFALDSSTLNDHTFPSLRSVILASSFPMATRIDRLSKHLVLLEKGKRQVTKPGDAKLLLEALCGQDNHLRCIERVLASPALSDSL